MSSMFRILVEAEGETYSYAKIEVAAAGDVYIIQSMGGLHLSRHASGRFHIKHEFDEEIPHIGVHYRGDIMDFKGLEALSTSAFGTGTFEAILHPQKEKYLGEPHFLFNANGYHQLARARAPVVKAVKDDAGKNVYGIYFDSSFSYDLKISFDSVFEIAKPEVLSLLM